MALIPILDRPVPGGRGEFRGFVWVPQGLNARTIVRLPPGQHPSGLPVPNAHFAVTVSARKIAGSRK